MIEPQYCYGAIVLGFLVSNVSPPCARGAFAFDPDGVAPGNPEYHVGAIHFKAGNSLYQGVGTLLVDGTARATRYVQASVDALLDDNNNPIAVNGLNTFGGFQLTMVAGYTVNTTIAGPSMSYSLAKFQNVDFFELFYNAVRSADDLSGRGFDFTQYPTGVRQIMSGYVSAASGEFTRSTGNVLFDQFGADNYSGLNTVTASGTGQFTIQLGVFDPTFFVPDPQLPLPLVAHIDSSDGTPFNSADPSQLFSDGSYPTVVPDLGPSNGTSSDFQAQVGQTFSFPEPSSTLLSAIGAGALAHLVRRRRRGRTGA
jgi:hypothetical protein